MVTANEEVQRWLETVAHQRRHNTTKQKPAERLIEERQALPAQCLPVAPSLILDTPLPASSTALSQQPLHHPLSMYEQLMEAV